MKSTKAKQLTPYQLQRMQETQKEFPCGMMHASIEEAIIHAMEGLKVQRGSGVALQPYLGTMKFGSGVIVGWQTANKQKRFRLDHDPDFQSANVSEAAKRTGISKGTQGIHVNEENFLRKDQPKICHPTEASLLRADGYWSKWSKEFGHRGLIKPEDLEKN